MDDQTQLYLQATRFMDYGAVSVSDFARDATATAQTDTEAAVNLYYAVRDQIRYDPYSIALDPDKMAASATVTTGVGYCVTKSILLAAAARASNIPSRLGYANVRNHLTTGRLKKYMKTDVFVFHGYTELLLDGSWVKTTPIFNHSLCDRFGVTPLEFDGRHDSLFHEFDSRGNRHMEYLQDHGHFADVPYEKLVSEFQKHYPHMYKSGEFTVSGDFNTEALED